MNVLCRTQHRDTEFCNVCVAEVVSRQIHAPCTTGGCIVYILQSHPRIEHEQTAIQYLSVLQAATQILSLSRLSMEQISLAVSRLIDKIFKLKRRDDARLHAPLQVDKHKAYALQCLII